MNASDHRTAPDEPPEKIFKDPPMPKGFQRRGPKDLIEATDFALNWSGRNLTPPEYSWFRCTYCAGQTVGESFVIYKPATLL